jgi:hypothetical protein
MIFKICSFAKELAFLNQNKAKLGKHFIGTFIFEKNAIFFAVNCRKSQKIVIITSSTDKLDKNRPNLTNPFLSQFIHM